MADKAELKPRFREKGGPVEIRRLDREFPTQPLPIKQHVPMRIQFNIWIIVFNIPKYSVKKET